MSRRALQMALATAGIVPTATELASLARGVSVVKCAGPAEPNVDSEHRYYAAFWTAVGPLLWHTALHPERHRARIDAISATMFLGGAARLLSARQVGRPQPLYRTLTAVELVLPIVMGAWQRGWWTKHTTTLSGRGSPVPAVSQSGPCRHVPSAGSDQTSPRSKVAPPG